MRKLLIFLIISLLLGCEKEPDPAEKLVGVWLVTLHNSDDYAMLSFIFNEDGTGQWIAQATKYEEKEWYFRYVKWFYYSVFVEGTVIMRTTMIQSNNEPRQIKQDTVSTPYVCYGDSLEIGGLMFYDNQKSR